MYISLHVLYYLCGKNLNAMRHHNRHLTTIIITLIPTGMTQARAIISCSLFSNNKDGFMPASNKPCWVTWSKFCLTHKDFGCSAKLLKLDLYLAYLTLVLIFSLSTTPISNTPSGLQWRLISWQVFPPVALQSDILPVHQNLFFFLCVCVGDWMAGRPTRH